MTQVLAIIRDPGTTAPIVGFPLGAEIRYGFGLMRGVSVTFEASSADPNIRELVRRDRHGFMVTIERSDGLHPWVGYRLRIPGGGKDEPFVQVALGDEAAPQSVLSASVTPKDWGTVTASAGAILQQMFAVAEPRSPMTMQVLDAGPSLPFTPQAETLLQLLGRMSQATGYEWALRHEVGGAVRGYVQWAGQIGSDRTRVVWEDGWHIASWRYADNAAGFLTDGMVVAGQGSGVAFADRPAAVANAGGQARPGASGVAAAFPRPVLIGLGGTRVVTLAPGFGPVMALSGAAGRAYESPSLPGIQLSIRLNEQAIDLTELEVGAIYSVRLEDTLFGLGADPIWVRLLGFALGQDGIVDTEVAAYPWRQAGAEFS